METRHQLTSLAVFLGGIVLLIVGEIAYDVWVNKHWGASATISDAMHAVPRIVVAAFEFVAGYAIGFLTAHFWWGAK